MWTTVVRVLSRVCDDILRGFAWSRTWAIRKYASRSSATLRRVRSMYEDFLDDLVELIVDELIDEVAEEIVDNNPGVSYDSARRLARTKIRSAATAAMKSVVTAELNDFRKRYPDANDCARAGRRCYTNRSGIMGRLENAARESAAISRSTWSGEYPY